MLTNSQRKTYQFIRQYLLRYGFSPTIAEITKGIGISSRGVVHRYIQAIADADLIELIPNKRRNIVLKSNPETHIPLIGCIAAGKPIEAIPEEESLQLHELLGGPNRYALKVKGESMIGEGIFDGDIVVCEHTNTANNGDIVVALIDNTDATLKRIYYEKNGYITLLPANATFSPITYPAERINIQGRFVGLLRLA